MNQIVHIFRKDCRHLWPTIAAVLVFTFLHGYGDVLIPSGAGVAVGVSPSAIIFILASLSGLLLPVLLFLLVVSVIQEESLVGSDRFWLTRPYNRRSLFLEKLLFVLLWAWAPMLLHDLILIHHFGFSLSSALGLLLWKHAQFGFFLLVAATVAVLSASFARAVLIAIVGLVGAAIIFSAVSRSGNGSSVGYWTATFEILTVLALAGVGALCVVAFQYRFRITPLAAVIVVVTIVLCALLSRFWPASLTSYVMERYSSTLMRPVELRPDAGLRNFRGTSLDTDAATQARTAYFPFHASGLADDVGLTVMGLSAQLDAPGEKPASIYLAAWVSFQPRPGGFADTLGGPDQLVAVAPALSTEYERLKNTDGTLTGHLVLQGFRSAVARVRVPSPGRPVEFSIGGRRCSYQSFPQESGLAVDFNCVELEPGNTVDFKVRLTREFAPASLQCPGQTPSSGSWPSFLSPILKTNYTCKVQSPAIGSSANGEPTGGLDLLVFAEENLGVAVRTFRIEHFRPADLTLQAWEERGVVKAESKSSSAAQP